MSDQDESLDRGPVEDGAPGHGPSEDDLEALRAFEEALDADTGVADDLAGDPPAGADGDEGFEPDPAERVETAGDDPLVEIERARTQRDEYLDALRRLQAEFDNYRKRVVREQTDLLERAAKGLVEQLLPVLDALDLAVAHSGATGSEEAASLGRIASLLADVLAKHGLERVGADGEAFDPTVHDAVAHVPAAEPAEGEEVDEGAHGAVIEEVLRPGYRMKGRVLRPAMVKVRG